MNEEVVLVEWFNRHYYRVQVDGHTHFLPSVTTKLGIVDKPNLDRWRADIGNREADLRMYDAGQKGTRIHWAYETALKGGAVCYDPWQKPVYTDEGLADLRKRYKNVAVLRTQEEMWAVVRLAEQTKRLDPKILGVEEQVVDLVNHDAGTIDNILEIKTGDYMVSGAKPLHLEAGIYVNDLKTGSYVDDGVWLQLAPYTFMWEQKHSKQAAGALVTHTGSTTKGGIAGLKTMVRTRKELIQDYQYYRHAAALWEREHEGEEPSTFEFPSLVVLPKEITNAV